MTAKEFLNELYWNLGHPEEIWVTPEFYAKYMSEVETIPRLKSGPETVPSKGLLFRDMWVREL